MQLTTSPAEPGQRGQAASRQQQSIEFAIFNVFQNYSPMTSRLIRIVSHYGRRAGLQFFVALANFLLIYTSARALSTSDFGFYSLILVANSFVLLVAIQPVTDGVNRFYSEAFRNGLYLALVKITVRVTSLIIALLVVVFIAVAVILTRNNMLPQHVSPWIYPVALTYFVLYALGSIVVTYCNASANYVMYAAIGAGTPILGAAATFAMREVTVLSAFSVIAIQATAWGTVLAFVAASRFHRLLALVRGFMDQGPSEAQRDLGKAFVRYIRPTPWLALAAFAFMFGDRILVAKFFSLKDVGLYSYMYVITTNVVVACFTIYATTTYLRAVEQFAANDTAEAQKFALRQFAWTSIAFPFLFFPLAIVYWIAGQQISILLFGPAARVPSECLAILLIAAALNAGAQQIAIIGNLLKRQHKFILPRWLAIGLLAVAIFVYHPSLTGVALAVLFTNAVYFVATWAVAFIVYKRTFAPSAGTTLTILS